jgi:hypothetical protein
MLEINNFMLDKHNIALFKLYCAITKIQERALKNFKARKARLKGRFFGRG